MLLMDDRWSHKIISHGSKFETCGVAATEAQMALSFAYT